MAIKKIAKKNLAKSQNLLAKEINILKELSELKHEHVVGLLECKVGASETQGGIASLEGKERRMNMKRILFIANDEQRLPHHGILQWR